MPVVNFVHSHLPCEFFIYTIISMKPSISDFVPSGTTYFYGYPAGEDSRFYNLVPPAIEELVSARPVVCAGADVNVIAFANSSRKDILAFLRDLGVLQIDDSRIIRLPSNITADQLGTERNKRIINALKDRVADNSLIMAQPYLDPSLQDKYQLSPENTIRMNDKMSMYDYIPEQYLPALLGRYSSGNMFANEFKNFAPCVVKVTSSSSGDGVRVCTSAADFLRAQTDFCKVNGEILVQEYIQAQENIGVQFGIPSDREKPIEVLGLSRQITTKEGEFMGGVVLKDDRVPEQITRALLTEILPAVRERGWYGIGGLDVLIDDNERFVFIDPNYRITAMTAYVYQMLNNVVSKNMLTMTARFTGNKDALRKIAEKNGSSQLLSLIALREDADGMQFNGALLFEDESSLMENANLAVEAGVNSAVLNALRSQQSDIILPNMK